MGRPLVHHRRIVESEQTRSPVHSWNRGANTLNDEKSVDCLRTYHSLRSA